MVNNVIILENYKIVRGKEILKSDIFEKLISKNEFPILFIGSGISKRYLQEFPSWVKLLELFWQELNEPTDFYGQYNILKTRIIGENPGVSTKEIEYLTNTKFTTLINTKYNKMFNEGGIIIDGFSTKDSFDTGIPPFKMSIVNKFSSYQIEDDLSDELELYKKALLKSQIIITTNYDTFIEDKYNSESQYGIKKYVGQSGFFEETVGYAELYKIHGCVTKPQSIVITENDYINYDQNSILISAKVISMLLNSPIIFFGYSLTDLNVRKYIKDFASSIGVDDAVSLEDKLIVIDWAEGEDRLLEEVIYDPELKCRFTYIRTDNYSAIYEYIHRINQGVAPSEIRKFKHIIKQIVIDAGKQGELKSVLVSPLELERIEEILASGGIVDQNLIVALGDSRIIFKIPNILTYLEDYIFEKNELTSDVALRFLAKEPPSGRYPFKRYLTLDIIEKSSLHHYEKVKLKQRLELQGNLEDQIASIRPTYRKDYNLLNEIMACGFGEDREYVTIAYNIKKLDINDVEKYLKEKVESLVKNGEARINTNLRRLMLVYDLIKN